VERPSNHKFVARRSSKLPQAQREREMEEENNPN